MNLESKTNIFAYSNYSWNVHILNLPQDDCILSDETQTFWTPANWLGWKIPRHFKVSTTLWLCQNSIVDFFPVNMMIFHRYVNVYQRVGCVFHPEQVPFEKWDHQRDPAGLRKRTRSLFSKAASSHLQGTATQVVVDMTFEAPLFFGKKHIRDNYG